MEIEENESMSRGLYKQIRLLDTSEEKGCGRNLGEHLVCFSQPKHDLSCNVFSTNSTRNGGCNAYFSIACLNTWGKVSLMSYVENKVSPYVPINPSLK